MMKKILYAGAALGFTCFGGCYYLQQKIYEKEFPAMKFCFKELQCDYNETGKEYAALDAKKEIFKDLYTKGDMSMLGLHYDNPQWLADPKKARSAIGFSVHNKDIAPETTTKISEGMTSCTDLPAFKAMVIPAYYCKLSSLYMLYLSLLMKKYIKKYHAELQEKNIPHVVVGGIYNGKVSELFIPIPTDNKLLNIIKAPLPEQNEAGKKYLAMYQKTTEVPKPVAPVSPAAPAAPASPAAPTTPAKK